MFIFQLKLYVLLIPTAIAYKNRLSKVATPEFVEDNCFEKVRLTYNVMHNIISKIKHIQVMNASVLQSLKDKQNERLEVAVANIKQGKIY